MPCQGKLPKKATASTSTSSTPKTGSHWETITHSGSQDGSADPNSGFLHINQAVLRNHPCGSLQLNSCLMRNCEFRFSSTTSNPTQNTCKSLQNHGPHLPRLQHLQENVHNPSRPYQQPREQQTPTATPLITAFVYTRKEEGSHHQQWDDRRPSRASSNYSTPSNPSGLHHDSETIPCRPLKAHQVLDDSEIGDSREEYPSAVKSHNAICGLLLFHKKLEQASKTPLASNV